MDERALIAACQRGEREAQRQLYEQYVPQVYALALRLTGSEHDAADICHDAFVRAFAAIRSFDGRSKLGTWLYRITVNEVRQRWRRQQTQQRHLEKLAELRATQVGEATEAADAEAVQAALDALSDDHRAILILRYKQGLSYHEIAEVLELPPGTIASRLNRARQALRARLERAESGLTTQQAEES